MKYLVTLVLASITTLAVHSEVALQEFVTANNLFTASLYREIAKKNEANFLMSPYSVETALAFAHSGCKEETALEIRKSLHLPEDREKIESAVKESISVLNEKKPYTLRTANKMYVKEGYSIKEGFKKAATDIYGADVENINFEQSIEAATSMNDWVEKQTNNKIKNLIPPDILNELTRAFLINTLYFKGRWEYQFSNHSTREMDFYKSNNDVVKVDTMHHYEEEFNYCENPNLNAKFLELPFEGGDVSMTIALPNEKEGITALENRIEIVLERQNFTNEYVKVALPKFKIESALELKKELKKLGINKAFDIKQADLSGIAGNKGDLYISDVVQKTYIDVEEGGVEAAAAAYVGIYKISARPIPKDFIADHPFIFYVKAKNFVIFAGRVSAPSY